jgi:D-alanyl-lipoteichoic acid acyltransferase DltB (MBOAT superfamily)
MLFNSIGYLLFLPLTVLLYYLTPFRWRWALLLTASYFFYLMWQAWFVVVLMTATIVSFYAARQMGRVAGKRQRFKYMLLTVFVNLGMLVVFKYLGFFSEIVNMIAGTAGSGKPLLPIFSFMLPVGISFYTFQTMGYAIDVYRGVSKPEKHLGIYALFVSFFPLVLAGPIERGRRLIPQLHVEHRFDPDTIASGMRLILWGMFKKVVIADRLSVFVQIIYAEPGYFHGVEIAVGVVLKMMQVYADFSGYTDIAIGSARMMGFKLSPNFNRPFTAQSIADFWSRWHISLTTWLRDYVYFALPFKYKGKVVQWRLNINLLITFILVGFWHGPYWNFIIFGFLHGLFMIMANVTKPFMTDFNRVTGLNNTPVLLRGLNITATFLLVSATGFFFGQQSVGDSFLMIRNLTDFSHTGTSMIELLKNNDFILGILLVIFMLWFEHLLAKRSFAVKFLRKPLVVRFAAYLVMLFFILVFGVFSNQKFFYFQF